MHENGLGSEHPLNDRLQSITVILFSGIMIVDHIRFLLSESSSVLADVISFPLLILPAAAFLIAGFYFLGKSRSKVFVKRAKFIDSSVYSVVRHPMYLGTLMTMLGFLFVSVSLTAFAIWIAFFFILNRMATYEEKDLTRKLGKKYINYQK